MSLPRFQTTSRAFTLLELIIVLALLSTVAAIAAPRLSGFMSGRNIREEARRMLSLTRYARAEAINRGMRLKVWFDPKTSTYGLRADKTEKTSNTSTSNLDAPNLEYTCQKGLTFNIDAKSLDSEGLATILFWPDGGIDPDSIARVELLEDGNPYQALAHSQTGLEYSLEDMRNEPSR